MARPKTVKNGKQLNLYVPAEVKRALFRMAAERGKSVSAVVGDLAVSAAAKASSKESAS